MKVKRILGLYSDLHVGSSVAIFPKSYRTRTGRHIPISKGQAQLLAYWNNMTKHFKDCDTHIILGDLIEGLNKKEYGHGLMCGELNDQVNACAELLKPMVGDKKVLIFTGSGYHGSADYKCDEAIAKSLPNAEFCGAMQNIRVARTGVKINLAHGEGGGSLYRTTKMDKESMFFKLAESCDKLESPDLIVRGHLHYYTYLENEQMGALQLPCWKAFEISKIFLKNIGRLQPDIGGCKLYIMEDDTILVRPYLYKVPHIADDYKTY